MTPQQLLAALQSLGPRALDGADHATLYMARAAAPAAMQDQLSGAEHRAFAREATAENPMLALQIAAGTLAYQPYKMLTGQARSGASLDQVGQGLAGVGEGLWQALQRYMPQGAPPNRGEMHAALSSY